MFEIVCWTCKKKSRFSGEEEKAVCQNQECRQVIVDEDIWPLVAIVNLMGLTTTGSCEGHNDFDNGYYPYPWISFEKTVPIDLLARLWMMIEDYNCANRSSSQTKNMALWRLEWNEKADCWWVYPEDGGKDIFTLRQESKTLAEHLKRITN